MSVVIFIASWTSEERRWRLASMLQSSVCIVNTLLTALPPSPKQEKHFLFVLEMASAIIVGSVSDYMVRRGQCGDSFRSMLGQCWETVGSPLNLHVSC